MPKTFSLIGYSTDPVGTRKVRFANFENRVDRLRHVGHTDIEFHKLPRKMTKDKAIDYLGQSTFDRRSHRAIPKSKMATIPLRRKEDLVEA